jgi:hypothetical protein
MNDRLDKAYENAIRKLKSRNNKLENQKKEKVKTRTTYITKRVVTIKSELDINISKSELVSIKRIICAYLKKNNSRFKKQFDKNDVTARYWYSIYSDAFKVYNKMNGKYELSPIYNYKLLDKKSKKDANLSKKQKKN